MPSVCKRRIEGGVLGGYQEAVDMEELIHTVCTSDRIKYVYPLGV